MNHDQLQKKCFDFLWNTYPATRRTFWHTPNEQRRYPGETAHHHMIRLTQAKSIGVLKGVVDLVWYWKGALHTFDIKIGSDSISDDQQKFIAAIVEQGGTFTEIRTFEDFKSIVEKIVN
jgi:hypothetical protein